ncbi:MAG: hypothetical protein IJ794_16355 [Lachnospiraceae bacterium]|nr:hypothetical protein [Lachnospiraceae bacterium]
MLVSTLLGIVAIVICMAIGMNFHPIYLTTNAWMIVVGIYIAVASVTPVWILLQPRDYLSSFLLYAMLGIAAIGVIGAHPNMDAFPAFTGFAIDNGNGIQYIFPILFTTVACGAISGFHSLVSSGTTSKQLDKETDAKPIAYGGMLLECVLAILTYKVKNTACRYTKVTGGVSFIILVLHPFPRQIRRVNHIQHKTELQKSIENTPTCSSSLPIMHDPHHLHAIERAGEQIKPCCYHRKRHKPHQTD